MSLVKVFEQKLQDFGESKAELQDHVHNKLEEFELITKKQNNQLTDVLDESKHILATTARFSQNFTRMEQEIDTIRMGMSDKMANNHQQISKKVNLANYELEAHRGDLLKLKS